jgi:AAA+ ATPase superfamily predicted ATPase
MNQVYLLTGRPRTGKTSLIKEVVAQMKGKAGGFTPRKYGYRE